MNYLKGNLLTVQNGIIVHGCNAQGKMNSGVAKAIREKYPVVFEKYINDINNGLQLGGVSYCDVSDDDNLLIVASAITQEFYGTDGKKYVSYDAIDSAFKKVFQLAIVGDLSVYMPLIGSGLGGGCWEVISAIINESARIKNFPRERITVYEL